MNDKNRKCPYCGQTIKAQAKKCRFCHNWLNNKEITEQVIKISCPYCGEEILSNADICTSCGENLHKNLLNKEPNNFSKPSSDTVTMVSQVLSGIITLGLIIWGLSYIFSDTPFTLLNPIRELTSGCTNNGDSGTLRYNYAYYCKNKLWRGVSVNKEINEKYYDYDVFDDSEHTIASYNWYDGDYHCKYDWIKGDKVCSASEFVHEIKNGLKKRQLGFNNRNKLESLLISGCSHTTNHSEENFIVDSYVCSDKPWGEVMKLVRPLSYEFSYSVFVGNNNHLYMSSENKIGEIDYQWGDYLCKYTGNRETSNCSEDEFVHNVTQLSNQRIAQKQHEEQERLQQIEQAKQARIRAEQQYREQRRYNEAQSFF